MAGIGHDFGIWKMDKFLVKVFNDLSRAELKLYAKYFRVGGCMIDYKELANILSE